MKRYPSAGGHPSILVSLWWGIFKAMGVFDPERLTLPQAPTTTRKPVVDKPPRHQPGQRFLKGPIPMVWLNRAGLLPGKALHVGIVLWHLAGLKKAPTVALSTKLLADMGVARTTGYRALTALEQAGLVAVQRHPGRSPRVTLLAVGGDDNGG